MPGFADSVRINITGCPNNCGQAWVADIGLEGKKVKHEGVLQDAYYFAVGGALGQHAGFARQINYRAVATQVPDAIEHLLREYLKDRSEGENLRSWFARTDDEHLRTVAAGHHVRAVNHDKDVARSPAGVD